MEKNRSRRRIASILCWIIVAAWMGLIFFFSTLPEATTPGRYILPDKIAHAGEYFILALLILVALSRTTRVGFATSLWIILAWVGIYGLSDEIHQLYVPTRHFEVGDLVADVCGAVALFFILWVLQKSGERGAQIYRLIAGKERQ